MMLGENELLILIIILLILLLIVVLTAASKSKPKKKVESKPPAGKIPGTDGTTLEPPTEPGYKYAKERLVNHDREIYKKEKDTGPGFDKGGGKKPVEESGHQIVRVYVDKDRTGVLICPNCEAENVRGRTVCISCGDPL